MSREERSRTRGSKSYSKTKKGPEEMFPHWPFDEIRIPYRERAERIKWPGNSPLCVYTYVTAEWRSPQLTSDSRAKFRRDLREESNSGQYELAVGIWRAINLLDRFGLKVSIFAHTGMVDRYPDLFRELHGKGHEVITRTYNGHPTTYLTPKEERAEIRRCTSIVEKAIGTRPRGFNNPGGKCTDQTPHILGEEGYLWMGGLKGDDLPYGIKTQCGRKIVVIGSRHSHTNDNAIFYSRGARSASEAFEHFKGLFDAYYDLGKKEFPGAMNYGIHPHLSCVPERFSFQERAFDYMLKFKDVWFVRCVDLAEYWKDHYLGD